MADKARQHILPRVYQRPFADSTPPENWPEKKPFEPRIWIIPKGLDVESRPRSPENAFFARRYYTLRDDIPEDPRIERALGLIETRYGILLPRLIAREELEDEKYYELLFFIGSLRARTPRELDHWQSQWAELERIYRMVERAHTGSEHQSDAEFWMGDEMAKRLLFDQASAWAKVAGPHSWLLVNKTIVPFLSSDAPATHSFVHRDELERLGFSTDVIPEKALRSDRAFFSYCPLTPQLALVSSPLLLSPDNTDYRDTHDAMHIMLLNEYMRSYADNYLISPMQDPYGPSRVLLREMDEARRRAVEQSRGIGVVIYTQRDRLEIPCDAAVHEDGPNPLRSRITFRTQHTDRLATLSVGEVLGEVTVYETFRATAGIRGARVISIAANATESTVIEADVRYARSTIS